MEPLDTVNVNFNTIMALINRDFKKAMFQTPVTGHFDMSCAAWTGYGNFSNNGTDFPGNFKIDRTHDRLGRNIQICPRRQQNSYYN